MLMSGQNLAGDLVGDGAKRGYTFEILAKPIEIPELLGAAARLLAAS
jgi:hypothetical protein